MGEFGHRVVPDVTFHLSPITLIIPDLLAVGTDGQQAGKCSDLLQSLLEAVDEFLPLLFLPHSFRDVLRDAHYRSHPA